jgi:hypothetical protein
MNPPLIPLGLQLFASAVLLGLLGWVVYLIRRGRLSLRDSLLWLLSTGAALVLMAFPELLRSGARLLHVEVPANALFAAGFIYVLLNLLSLTIAVSSSAERIRRLAQDCALLRAEIEALRREQQQAGEERARRAG